MIRSKEENKFSFPLKIKKHSFRVKKCWFGGAGEIRTLVQTSSRNAFYMLSFLLFFVIKPEKSRPTISLSLKVLLRHQGAD